MTTRHRGLLFKTLLPRLPRNLAVFDGRCVLSQARVSYVLERNFNYLSIPSYLLGNTEDTALEKHRIYFTSFNLVEGKELRRVFFANPLSSKSLASARIPRSSARASSQLPRLPNDLVLLFVEKVPSRNGSLLRQAGGRYAEKDQNTPLFALKPEKTSSSLLSGSVLHLRPSSNATHGQSSEVHTRDTGLVRPEDTDLVVSTNFAAMCRIGMHLDRIWLRMLCRVLYYCIPSPWGEAWFDRTISTPRRRIWGTSDTDAVEVPTMIDGMKLRRWSWRKRYSS